MGNGVRTLSIDIGGSGIKTFVLDEQGNPLTERLREPTPEKPTPDAVLQVLSGLIEKQGEFDRISVGFPGVVRCGEIRSAVNLDPSWIGFNLADALSQAVGKPTRVANDADVQGLAAIEGKGVELVLTLGTGLGSALFTDGHLVPNLEMGHHPFRKGRTYEEYLGAASLEAKGKKKWNGYLLEAIVNLERLFSYRMLYLGGGNTKRIEIDLPPNATTVPNVAGLLGGIALWHD